MEPPSDLLIHTTAPVVEAKDAHCVIPSLEDIARVESEMLRLPQIDIPLRHTFAPGVYMRTVKMPAGSFVIGHQHKTRHLNIVHTGHAIVFCGKELKEIRAPYVFESGEDIRKLLYIIEDMAWSTIHPTTETDIAKLEELLIVKSAAYLEAKELQGLIDGIDGLES